MSAAATILGAPGSSYLGDIVSWRSVFPMIAVLRIMSGMASVFAPGSAFLLLNTLNILTGI